MKTAPKGNLMTSTHTNPSPPVWFGVHRDALIIVCLLDILWTLIEFSAAATVIGIPAIPFVALLIFVLSFVLTYNKQRIVGDNQVKAAGISVLLSAFAAIPFSFISLFLAFFCGIANKMTPNTKGVKIRIPSSEDLGMGKFANDFKILETRLQTLAQQNGLREGKKLYECIGYLKAKELISPELFNNLDHIRVARNQLIHDQTTVPSTAEQRLLNRCLEDITDLKSGLQRKQLKVG